MKLNAKALLGATALALIAGSASAADLACLITKRTTPTPFFVKMKEGAEAAAAAAGLDFQAYAGEKTVTLHRRSPRLKTASLLAPRAS